MSPTETVKQFLRAWETDQGFPTAVREFFTPGCLYENVGLSSTAGPDEALAFIAEFVKNVPFASIGVEMLGLVAQGDIVMTERVDHLRASDGRRLASLRVMGVFVVEDGRIAAWRDYFDASPFR